MLESFRNKTKLQENPKSTIDKYAPNFVQIYVSRQIIYLAQIFLKKQKIIDSIIIECYILKK